MAARPVGHSVLRACPRLTMTFQSPEKLRSPSLPSYPAHNREHLPPSGEQTSETADKPILTRNVRCYRLASHDILAFSCLPMSIPASANLKNHCQWGGEWNRPSFICTKLFQPPEGSKSSECPREQLSFPTSSPPTLH